MRKTDLQAIELETKLQTGDAPTLETLVAEGYRENRLMNAALDWIGSAGRVVTLLVAESIQAGAALIIGIMFAMLEYWRVYHGAGALGQSDTQSALIAFAVVTANVVHPIYSLRQLRGQHQLEIVKMTGRGLVTLCLRRVFGKPSVESVDLYYNPTLHLAATVITWSTVILAIYDILRPLLTQLFTGTLDRPLVIAVMELVMGLGLSVAGVLFLQSASHEIGVRTLTDRPERLTDVLERRRAEHAVLVEKTREKVRARYMAEKAAAQRQQEQEVVHPFGITAHELAEGESMPMSGRANGHGGENTTEN